MAAGRKHKSLAIIEAMEPRVFLAVNLSNTQFTVGTPEYVMGPVATLADNPFFVLDINGQLQGYTDNQKSYLMTGSTLENLTLQPNPAIGPGSNGDFDETGAWLASAFQDGNVVTGFYHAEENSDYNNGGQTHKSVAFAQSFDGGKTFVKTNYPNNQIITSSQPEKTGWITGIGDPTVVKFNGYYYAYLLDDEQNGEGVARSLISSGGGPGTWFKYYNGSFSEPGLNGKISMLSGIHGTSTYNYADGGLINVGNVFTTGAKLGFSPDGINWQELSVPLVYSDEQNWVRSPSSRELMVYPSLVSPSPNEPVGDSFYLYYTYLAPGKDFTDRYLLRRLVTSTTSANPVVTQARTELDSYFNPATKDHWVTTTYTGDAYSSPKTLGYILNAPLPGTIPIYDSYIPVWGDHMVALQGEVDNGTNPDWFVNLRTLGWVWAQQQPGTVPIYRYFDSTTNHHGVSLSDNDPSLGTKEFVIGYVYPPPTTGATISGTVFNDVNSNSAKDANDSGIAGWTVYLDKNNNNALDAGETSTTTSADGSYTFTNLPAGTYYVKQVFQSGYRKTLPTNGVQGYTFAIAGDAVASGKDFGETKNIFLGGVVFNDVNSNGVQDAGETGIPGFTINVLTGGSIIASRVTNADGKWQVKGLSAGSGEVDIVPQANYTIINPASGNVVGSAASGQQIGNLNFALHKIAPAPIASPVALLKAADDDLLVDELIA